MTFSETSGKVPGTNVPLILGFEAVNMEKFGPEVTLPYQLQVALLKPLRLQKLFCWPQVVA